jgi:hypothetical protein
MAAFGDKGRCGEEVGFTRQRRGHLVPTPRQECEHRAEDCARAAERADDIVLRKMLLMLALQWKLAAQWEPAKQTIAETNS